MKRLFSLLCALALLFALASCTRVPAVSETVPGPTLPAAPAETEAPAEPYPPAVLSPGAADSSRLSAPFGPGTDGALLTSSLAYGEAVAPLPVTLPEELGYVTGFVREGAWIFAALKPYATSLEPAALYRFPAEGGEGELLVSNLAPNEPFCLAGDALLVQSYEDMGLRRCELSVGAETAAVPGPVTLLAAADGFVYYARGEELFRNDGTLTAEVSLGAADLLFLGAEDGVLCGLTEDGGAVTWRGADGAPIASLALAEPAGSLLFTGGLAYVPQTGAGTVLVLDNGAERGALPLPEAASWCLLRYADADALYCQIFREEEFSFALVRLPLAGSAAETVGAIDEF